MAGVPVQTAGGWAGAADSPKRGDSLLRFSTAGSVDDGKSTLIGRLLYDSQAVFEDQMASVRKSNINRSTGPVDFSLLTDGLRAEREQGITIDVAYRYFSSARRKFIIADTPGHEQYTRNMATGASTADAAVILIDATKGVLHQSRRHAYIASLLGVQHLIAAVNKMDLIDFSREAFERIAAEFGEFAAKLGVQSLYAVPVSALEGDNVARRSRRTPWFHGPALLEYLEHLPVSDEASIGPLRFPVQYVIRPGANFRGFAGQVASGVLRPGTTVIALPSGERTRVKSIVSFEGELEEAGPRTSVNVTLADEIDLSRGDVLAGEKQPPSVASEFQATVVWMHAERLNPHKTYLLKHTTRMVRARVKHVRHRVDVNTLERATAATLGMNDIGEVEIQTALPLYFDAYRLNRTMGSFIVIDAHSNATVAAGIIERAAPSGSSRLAHAHKSGRTTREERILRFGHPPAIVWLPGRPRAAERLERRLFEEGWHTQMAGPVDFLAGELPAAAKACFLAGSIAVFSPPEEAADQAEYVRGSSSPGDFFAFENLPESDDEAADRIAEQLHRWRDAQSHPPGDQK